MADCEAVRIRTDVTEDCVEVSLVGDDLVVEAIFEHMVYPGEGVNGILESRDKETEMLGECGLYPKQYVHMIGHNDILFCPESWVYTADMIEHISDYATRR